MKPPHRQPVVAIVGRPNVGKSTLFNRILRRNQAIVHGEPGLTRDRHYGKGNYRNRPFVLIDTGGYEDAVDTALLQGMRQQTLVAIEEADAIIFLTELDVINDPVDQEIIERLRAGKKPFYLAVNKADNHRQSIQAIADFSVYGLDNVYPVSALHGEGVFDLLDDLTADFSEGEEGQRDDNTTRVAIVGRQNVGKSTLANRLLGEERVIASEVAGTTRDAIDTPLSVNGREYLLIDTAGIRRRGKIERGAEKLSVHSSFRAIDRADVALLLVDAAEGPTTQDEHIAGYILESGKSCILVLNKWDAVADREKYGEHIKRLREAFNFLRWAPIVTISARTGQRAHKLWGLIDHCAEQFVREFRTRDLNMVLAKATAYVSPPITGARQLKINYVTQTATRPPTLTFFVNDPKLLHFSYERFLQNQFRKQLDFDAAPLHFRFKKKAVSWAERQAGYVPQERRKGTRTAPAKPEFVDPSGEFEAVVLDEDGAPGGE